MNQYSEKEASDMLKKIFTPFLLVMGLIGNLLSIAIFSKPHMRKQTTFRYLTYLSVFDLSTLLTGYGQTFFQVYFDLDIRLINEFSCKFHSFLVYFFSQSSSMILICMSIDRTIVIATKYGKKMSTIEITKKFLMFIIASNIIINLHFILFARIIEIPYYLLSSNETYFSNETLSTFNSSNIETDMYMNQTASNGTMTFYKACYGSANSLYFMYLVEFFPW